MADQRYAVITGDIVDFSKIPDKHHPSILNAVKESFENVSAFTGSIAVESPFTIFRGDSFQGLIPDPRLALRASLIIRAGLRKSQPEGQPVSWDARTAIGIGTVNYLPEKVSEGDGAAFRRSGPRLDSMKGEHRLTVNTPWKPINEELESPAALLDAVIAKWSPKQAEIVSSLLQKKERKEIASEFGISQSAVHYRVKGSGWFAIKLFLERYYNLLEGKRKAS